MFTKTKSRGVVSLTEREQQVREDGRGAPLQHDEEAAGD
jgi:hypothetical protein